MSTTTETQTDEQTTLADSLRQAADLLEAHPDLPKPYLTSPGSRVEISWFLHHADDGAETMRRIVAAIGGKWRKASAEWSGPLMELDQRRGPLSLMVSVARDQVCERVSTGVQTVTETVKDPEALARVPEIETTREVETFEWRCSPLLQPDTAEEVAI